MIYLGSNTEDKVDELVRLYGSAFIQITQIEPGLTGVKVLDPRNVTVKQPCAACEKEKPVYDDAMAERIWGQSPCTDYWSHDWLYSTCRRCGVFKEEVDANGRAK